MKTKWRVQSEYADGTGDAYYECECPQTKDGEVFPTYLYSLCYMPSRQKLWFWDGLIEAAETTRMRCTSWEQAETIKAMLTMGESHWMEPAGSPVPPQSTLRV